MYIVNVWMAIVNQYINIEHSTPTISTCFIVLVDYVHTDPLSTLHKTKTKTLLYHVSTH